MNTTPKISVIMSVYNGEKYLAETIVSILEQSFTEFEFIIVNDASTDTTDTILENFSHNDPRIHVITNSINRERCFSRNLAIAHARCNLIAVMDADDWAHPTRLEKQFHFMQEHPEVDVCGSALRVYSTGELWLPPIKNQHIRAQLLFNSCIYNPTVIFKKDKIINYCRGYSEDFQTAQDYDLWSRLSLHSNVVFANIPEPLLRYRIYPIDSRANYYTSQKNNANTVRLRLLDKLFSDLSQEDFNNHLILSEVKDLHCLEELYLCGEWAKSLIKANTLTRTYNHNYLYDVVTQCWLNICNKASRSSLESCYVYYKIGLSPNNSSVFWCCSIMILHFLVAKILPLNTRRRKLVKYIFSRYKKYFALVK